MTAHSPSAIPVHILTGVLGAGKTTAIARLLTDKPPAESWLVILNEFTDTGIDALTLASAASGAYDLRMIPGGCLCCTGEEDFRRQLANLLAQPRERWPARILIEPSGIAHPGMIVEELRGYERGGALALRSIIALIDAQSWRGAVALTPLAREQADAADVVLLSKSEQADESVRQQFHAWAAELFPAKRFVGMSETGALPAESLCPPPAHCSFVHQPVGALLRPSPHQHAHVPDVSTQLLQWWGQPVSAQIFQLLGRESCGWKIPGALLFDERELMDLLKQSHCWQGVERFKAVLRTGVDQWRLVQRWNDQYSIEVCAWRQDSRIELQLGENVSVHWPVWHARWQAMSELCPVS